MRSYFAFSQTESRGALLLILLTLVALGAGPWLSARKSQAVLPSSQDWHTLDSLVAVLDQMEATSFAQPKREAAFPFNPNTADSATLTRLGFKPWIAQRMINYRQKGGTFRIKSDVKKIYGLSDATYQRLYDYLQLPEQLAARSQHSTPKSSTQLVPAPRATAEQKKEKERVISLDINQADTTSLKQLRGIGSVLANRIVKYRQKLGGFHTTEQLREVYHMTETGTHSVLKSTYVAEDHQLRLLNINQADVTILAQHPYISWDLAQALVQHRQDYGKFRSLDDLREVYLINENVVEKIAPYLEI